MAAKRQAIIAQSTKREALTSERRAVLARQEAERAQQTAELTAEQRRRLLYAANMQVAYRAWNSQEGTANEVQKLLAAWIPTDSKEDLREFSWRYLWTRLHCSALHTVLH